MSNFHKFKNRNILNKRPLDINKEKWDVFLTEMQRADNLEILDHPLQIDVELNSGCNMNCPFCLHGYENIKNYNMCIDQYHKIIDEAVALGTTSLKLNYINEPMLRKDLEDCIKYAKDAGIVNIYFVTNGTLLNKNRRKRMIASGVTKIFISIDAVTSGTYNQQRLDGRFPLVVENVCALIDERNNLGLEFPIVRVSFLKNALNIHEEDEFKEFWENKADVIAFQKMNEVPDQKTGLIITDSEMPDKGCEFPFKQLVIDAYGDIQPCCKMAGKKLKIGNIQNMSLDEAWNSKKMKGIQKLHIGDLWKTNDICRDCMMSD